MIVQSNTEIYPIYKLITEDSDYELHYLIEGAVFLLLGNKKARPYDKDRKVVITYAWYYYVAILLYNKIFKCQ